MPVLVPGGPVGPVLPLGGNKAARARYQVEVAWGQNSRGLFTFGLSQFGGSDVLAASSWSQTFTDPHADITNPGDGTRVDSIQITRGRDDDLNATQSGACTITIRDPIGKFNNKNPGSMLNGFLNGSQPLRVSSYLGAGVYRLYYGFIQDIEYQRVGNRGGEAQITCLDMMSRLAPSGTSQQSNPVLPFVGPTTTGAAVGRVLDFYQWTDPAMRALGVGDTIPGFQADGTVTALQLIEDLLTAERGFFFVRGDGAVVYIPRLARYTATSRATVVDVMEQLNQGATVSEVVNQWTVRRTDFAGNPLGVAQVASDTASSQKLFNLITNELDTPYLQSDAQALLLAQYLILRTKAGASPVYGMNLRNKDATTLGTMLSTELGDRVTVTEDATPSTNDYFVEQIVHNISEGGLNHQTSWKLSSIPAYKAFTFGVSQFGGSDVLVY